MHRKQNRFVFKCPECGSTLGAGVDFAIPPPSGPIRRHCLECRASFTPKQFKKYRSKDAPAGITVSVCTDRCAPNGRAATRKNDLV